MNFMKAVVTPAAHIDNQGKMKNKAAPLVLYVSTYFDVLK